ncbi:MAG: ATP-binding cassette domain-containing protein [Xanthomonadaceae bacterium]|nr:ATP-binding cassette domain-containing protein [Xanthomonadaceae bacterium]
MPLVILENVQRLYSLGETTITALEDINLTIRREEFIALWGPSGSGKSTLCNLIGALDQPTRGKVFLNGRDIELMSDDRQSEHRNRSVGFIFQDFNLIPVLTSLENVMLPLILRGEREERCREKALEILTAVGLAPEAKRLPDKLSGGQQQRVAIARALVTNPPLVVADEPTANLDSENAARIINLMRKLNQSLGTAFIFSTHDQKLLLQVKRRIQLHDGHIIEDISDV